MTIVFASHNKDKIEEMRRIFSDAAKDHEITVLGAGDVGVGDVEETGTTFEENALIKARAVADAGYIAIADDSGLCVDALGGEPGVFSKRWSGGTPAENNQMMLEKLKDVPTEKRGAHFVSVIACVLPDGSEPIIAEGKCSGIIAEESRGNGGFGYDPVFLIPSLGKTFAELTPEEKNEISHRGKAMRELQKRLPEIIERAKALR